MTAEIKLLRQILDSLAEAYFAFGRDGICLSVHSANCKKLLGIDPAGARASRVLKIPAYDVETFNSWCSHLFAETLDFEDLVSFGPALLPREDGRQIEISYRPLRDSAGKLEAVLAIVADRTDELVGRREMEKAKHRAEMIIRITEDREQFSKFVDFVREVIARLCEADLEKLPAVSQVTRDFHTLKGAALSFHLVEMMEMFQSFEKRVALLDGADPRICAVEFRDCANRIETVLNSFLVQHRHLFRDPGNTLSAA